MENVLRHDCKKMPIIGKQVGWNNLSKYTNTTEKRYYNKTKTRIGYQGFYLATVNGFGYGTTKWDKKGIITNRIMTQDEYIQSC